MSDEFDENVISLFQRMLPLICSALFLLVAYLPINMFVFNNIRPDFGLMCVYFWVLYRPDLFNLASVVVLSLLDMVLSSALPGSGLLVYVTMYLLLYNTQKFLNAKPFIVIWYGFMALSLISLLVKWLVVSIYYSQFLPLTILMFSYLIGVALYPVVAMILGFVQNCFIQDDGL